jgi:hypothetical protein
MTLLNRFASQHNPDYEERGSDVLVITRESE